MRHNHLSNVTPVALSTEFHSIYGLFWVKN